MMGRTRNRKYSPASRLAVQAGLPPLIRMLMKRDWQGRQHLMGRGGVIVAANHLSYADWAAMSLFVHEAGRFPVFWIKSSAFDVKPIGAFLHVLGQLPVRRGEADAALVLKPSEEALAAGECVVIYPEGTATRDPQLWPMVAKTGVARLALTTGASVIPVAVWGAQVILPYGTTRPHVLPRKMVRMQAGPPVDLSEYAGKPLTRAVLRSATNVIMADITTLLAQLRDEQPPGAPYSPASPAGDVRVAAADDTDRLAEAEPS